MVMALVALSGCSNKNSNEDNNEKIASELEYISSKIFDLSNKLNNISSENYELVPKEIELSSEKENSGSSGEKGESSSETSGEESSKKGEEAETVTSTKMKTKNSLDTNNNDSEIDWQSIKTEIELINNIWSVINIDLAKEKVADNDIQEFNAKLNQTIISIKNEDKNTSLENISNLYSFIPTFMNYISINNSDRIVTSTKAELLKAYTAVSLKNWESVSTHVANAKNMFISILDENEEIKNNEFKIDKVRTLIQNLESSVKLEDEQLFLVHYKILIEQIDKI